MDKHSIRIEITGDELATLRKIASDQGLLPTPYVKLLVLTVLEQRTVTRPSLTPRRPRKGTS